MKILKLILNPVELADTMHQNNLLCNIQKLRCCHTATFTKQSRMFHSAVIVPYPNDFQNTCVMCVKKKNKKKNHHQEPEKNKQKKVQNNCFPPSRCSKL